ncbi:hypothetical protein D3C71_1798290 [compost metagenome]
MLYQHGRALDHQARWPEYLPCLLFGRRAGVDLCAELIVSDEHRNADAGSDHAFAVLARHLPIGLTEAAQTSFFLDPAECHGQAELLPRLQRH